MQIKIEVRGCDECHGFRGQKSEVSGCDLIALQRFYVTGGGQLYLPWLKIDRLCTATAWSQVVGTRR